MSLQGCAHAVSSAKATTGYQKLKCQTCWGLENWPTKAVSRGMIANPAGLTWVVIGTQRTR